MLRWLGHHYQWIQALHVICVIAWMAGVFYLPRLYVYHTMTTPGSAESERMKVMERRLLRQIMHPALLASWFFGLLLVITPGMVNWSSGWWWVKLVSVVLLTIYHLLLGRWRRGFLEDRNRHSELFYRVSNEVPTVLMIAIVIMAIVKPF
jgi:protoporphyrinogen IX oxidase